MGSIIKKTSPKIDMEYELYTNFRKGIDLQREHFKDAKVLGNFDTMADSLENLKSEIKAKLVAKGRKKELQRIENILSWFRTKEKNYMKKTPQGVKVNFPPNMPVIINHNLTVCYELLIDELNRLGLL